MLKSHDRYDRMVKVHLSVARERLSRWLRTARRVQLPLVPPAGRQIRPVINDEAPLSG